MLNEIVIAIDPALRRIEDVLLWKNKFKTILIFSLFHILFWLYFAYNIRTYCLISTILLFLHLLDAYRTKKRKLILKFKAHSNKIEARKADEIDNLSSLGRYLIYVNKKTKQIWSWLMKMKKRNRLSYFLILLVVWSMLLVVGIKIKSAYLAYGFFWFVFLIPAVIHYQVPKKLLQKALPLLQQLDHSMKYERRSILDKKELLVDVKLAKIEYEDELDEQDDELIESFNKNPKHRKVLEELDDEEDEDEDEIEEYEDQEEDEGDQDEDEEEEEEIHTETTEYVYKTRLVKTEEEEDELNSFLPNDTLPNINETQTEDTEEFNPQIELNNRVLKRKAKYRPSLQDYYGDSINLSTSTITSSSNENLKRLYKRNERDIDETFDFLDEELKKY